MPSGGGAVLTGRKVDWRHEAGLEAGSLKGAPDTRSLDFGDALVANSGR